MKILRNKLLKKLIPVLMMLTTFFSLSGLAFAASEQNGDAIYRSGALTFDHAGVYYNGKAYEMPGINHSVELNSMDTFQADETYYGPYYRTIYVPNVLRTCELLAADDTIGYTFTTQVDPEYNFGNYIDPSEIDDIRCDGLVEYAYEYNGYWVWGPAEGGTYDGTPTCHDVSYCGYYWMHCDLGKDQPWVEVSPYVQRGAAGLKWTTLRHR